MWKGKEPRELKQLSKEMKCEELIYLLSRLNLHLQYTVVQYSWKDKHINRWKRIKNPEIDPHDNAQMIFLIARCRKDLF